ncbi:MAG: 2-oxoacid:acceptor oxidoreductase family protein [Candidatus Euphemobacter frigidus]|nr:2-oxoacid:acceptor oxidoreductase family protein [Candidatus Euphemobacter frigidus]MDP8274849.1 2-oxoacid:acceptor oxidoreductase family protein [Candidatus Euphemobacter frigidus]
MERFIIAGFGGQGIMLAGKITIQAGLAMGRNVTFIPSYGAEVRGGTAHCHVIISEGEIASPIIARPDACLVMNSPSLAKFAQKVRDGGLLIINSSMVDEPTGRQDLIELRIPANRIAEELGNIKAANMAMLGSYIRHSSLLTLSAVQLALQEFLPSRHRDLLAINQAALQDGYDHA